MSLRVQSRTLRAFHLATWAVSAVASVGSAGVWLAGGVGGGPARAAGESSDPSPYAVARRQAGVAVAARGLNGGGGDDFVWASDGLRPAEPAGGEALPTAEDAAQADPTGGSLPLLSGGAAMPPFDPSDTPAWAWASGDPAAPAPFGAADFLSGEADALVPMFFIPDRVTPRRARAESRSIGASDGEAVASAEEESSEPVGGVFVTAGGTDADLATVIGPLGLVAHSGFGAVLTSEERLLLAATLRPRVPTALPRRPRASARRRVARAFALVGDVTPVAASEEEESSDAREAGGLPEGVAPSEEAGEGHGGEAGPAPDEVNGEGTVPSGT